MYKELEKYSKQEKGKTKGVFPDGQEIEIYLDKYEAKLGDLMEDYINHISIPKWKRKYYHSHLTKIYKDMLNSVVIQHFL